MYAFYNWQFIFFLFTLMLWRARFCKFSVFGYKRSNVSVFNSLVRLAMEDMMVSWNALYKTVISDAKQQIYTLRIKCYENDFILTFIKVWHLKVPVNCFYFFKLFHAVGQPLKVFFKNNNVLWGRAFFFCKMQKVTYTKVPILCWFCTLGYQWVCLPASDLSVCI